MQCQVLNSANTWVDISHLIAYQGWTEKRNDIDGPNAGRNQQGMMIRDRVAIKARYDVECVPMTGADIDMMNDLLYPTQFYMRFKKETDASWTQKLVYSNNYSWKYYQKINGIDYYFEFGFPFIEI